MCLWALADLAFSVFGIHAPPYLTRYATAQTSSQRAVTDAVGLSFGPLLYTVHRRLKIAWKLGWVNLVACFSWNVVYGLELVLRTQRSAPDRSINLAVFTIASCAIAVYWGRWWYRQKRYFQEEPS